MKQEFYGEDLARYKLERAKEETENQIRTAKLVVDLVDKFISKK